MADILYLKIGQSIEVQQETVTLGEVASLECQDKTIVHRLKTMKLFKIPNFKTKQPPKKTRYVMSVLKVIEKIHEIYPSLQIENLGESDFVLEVKSKKDPKSFFHCLKVAIVCILIFFGSAFTIMSFNNDVSVEKMFADVYEKITGNPSSGFTIIEVMYSIGIFLGIVIFYNHFGKRKLSTDPTPIEVEMRKYEEDINKTLIEDAGRESEEIDVL